MYGRTLDGAVGAENAAVPWQGLEQFFAALALVEIRTRISGHSLSLGVTTQGARNGRRENYGNVHLRTVLMGLTPEISGQNGLPFCSATLNS